MRAILKGTFEGCYGESPNRLRPDESASWVDVRRVIKYKASEEKSFALSALAIDKRADFARQPKQDNRRVFICELNWF